MHCLSIFRFLLAVVFCLTIAVPIMLIESIFRIIKRAAWWDKFPVRSFSLTSPIAIWETWIHVKNNSARRNVHTSEYSTVRTVCSFTFWWKWNTARTLEYCVFNNTQTQYIRHNATVPESWKCTVCIIICAVERLSWGTGNYVGIWEIICYRIWNCNSMDPCWVHFFRVPLWTILVLLPFQCLVLPNSLSEQASQPISEFDSHPAHRIPFMSSCLMTMNTRSDNKVCELATVCLPWQQWAETSLWVYISWTDSQPRLLFEVLKRLHEKVRRKRPEIFANSWILHHDNAPAHTALSVREFLSSKETVGTPSLFTGSSPQWLFCVPEDKVNIETKAFLWHQE
jgi:hypothetical protein